jgi:hypothetical protein
MRTTLNLKPEALALVESLARQREWSLGEAASELILRGRGGATKGPERNGVPLFGSDPPMTPEEIESSLDEEA